MRRLVLMRHAQAEFAPGQSESDLFSLGDLPLSDHGRAQAAAARDALREAEFDAAFASPTQRATETAEVVAAPHGLDVEPLPALVEFPFWTPGAHYQVVLERILGFAGALGKEEDPTFPGGGTFREGVERFAGAVDGALRGHDSVLIVAHGLTNRAFLGRVLGMPPASLLAIEQDHACVNVLEYGHGGRPKVTALNWTPRPGGQDSF